MCQTSVYQHTVFLFLFLGVKGAMGWEKHNVQGVIVEMTV